MLKRNELIRTAGESLVYNVGTTLTDFVDSRCCNGQAVDWAVAVVFQRKDTSLLVRCSCSASLRARPRDDATKRFIRCPPDRSGVR